MTLANMANMGKITRTVQNERKEEKSPEDDVRDVLARVAETPDAAIDDLGIEETAQIRPRRGDNPDVMIDAAVKKFKLAIVERSAWSGDDTSFREEPLEPRETDPRLIAFEKQYLALSVADRKCQGKIRITWAEVSKAIPNMSDFLAGVDSLTEPRIYFLTEEGQLVVGDGCAEPPDETLGVDYAPSRSKATRISYIDSEGEAVVIKGDDTKIPPGAQVLSERGLITLKEYQRVNKGQFEQIDIIWTESGKNPSAPHRACWSDGVASADSDNHSAPARDCGSRCVLRVNLNFKS